jgi:ParB-like chromosome segregation protein Spo0J
MHKEVSLKKIDCYETASTVCRASYGGLFTSMKDVGLINPITLVEAPDGRFRLLAGHVRLDVARALGWHRISAIVWETDTPEKVLKAIPLAENLHRAPMDTLSRAALSGAYSNLMGSQVAVHEAASAKGHHYRHHTASKGLPPSTETPLQKERFEMARRAGARTEDARFFASMPFSDAAAQLVLRHKLVRKKKLLRSASAAATEKEVIDTLLSCFMSLPKITTTAAT